MGRKKKEVEQEELTVAEVRHSIMQTIKKSAANIRRAEKDLRASENDLVKYQGLDKNNGGLLASTVKRMRRDLFELKHDHNQFVRSQGLRLEMFPLEVSA